MNFWRVWGYDGGESVVITQVFSEDNNTGISKREGMGRGGRRWEEEEKEGR
jgi:hypothetical protein